MAITGEKPKNVPEYWRLIVLAIALSAVAVSLCFRIGTDHLDFTGPLWIPILNLLSSSGTGTGKDSGAPRGLPALTKGNITALGGSGGSTKESELPRACPAWFSGIKADLGPWSSPGAGISQGMLAESKKHAHFRIQVISGRVFVEQFADAWNYRFNHTLWGLLMLLRRYPGAVPDVDVYFCLHDDNLPVSEKNTRPFNTSSGQQPTPPPPPIFQYCHDDSHATIRWPDWSFWGWWDLGIHDWREQCQMIARGGQAAGNWSAHVARAFWKGNVDTGRGRTRGLRKRLVACAGERVDAVALDWDQVMAAADGLSQTRLEDQCTHRYNVYAEGNAWSVSLKYKLCCGGTLLLIEPYYQDFYSHALVPHKHFIPVSRDKRRLCANLDEVVQWGEEHPEEAQAIAMAGQKFVLEELAPRNVYDYLLHLLEEYHALLKFTPQRSDSSLEVTVETFLANERAARIYRMVEQTEELPCRLGTLPMVT